MNGYITHDAKWFDSTLAFFINQLNKLDPKLHEPLSSVSWGRDIQLRSDVSFANEASSFIRTNISGGGTQSAQGKAWISPNTTDLPTVDLDGELVSTPVRLLGRTLSYSSVELERSQLVGMNLDVQKYNALNTLYQLDIDECVYIGDDDFSFFGLVNNTAVTSTTVPADGTGSSALWSAKTAELMVRDVTDAEVDLWNSTGNNVVAEKCLLPPVQFARLNSTQMSGIDKSALNYLKENSLCMAVNGKPLDVQPCKWLTGRGAGSTGRMVLYSNNENYVRFPLVPIRRETPYYQGIMFLAPYIWMLGQVEFVELTTVRYEDGI